VALEFFRSRVQTFFFMFKALCIALFCASFVQVLSEQVDNSVYFRSGGRPEYLQKKGKSAKGKSTKGRTRHNDHYAEHHTRGKERNSRDKEPKSRDKEPKSRDKEPKSRDKERTKIPVAFPSPSTNRPTTPQTSTSKPTLTTPPSPKPTSPNNDVRLSLFNETCNPSLGLVDFAQCAAPLVCAPFSGGGTQGVCLLPTNVLCEDSECVCAVLANASGFCVRASKAGERCNPSAGFTENAICANHLSCVISRGVPVQSDGSNHEEDIITPLPICQLLNTECQNGLCKCLLKPDGLITCPRLSQINEKCDSTLSPFLDHANCAANLVCQQGTCKKVKPNIPNPPLPTSTIIQIPLATLPSRLP